MSAADESLTFEVFTLFPDAVNAFVGAGLLGKAIERELVAVHCTNFRDFTTDKHRTVDDTPFGGGAGMVMKPEPVVAALEAVERERGPMHRILLTPSGARFDQRVAERLASLPRIALLCGRYEGIDDRVREHYVDECLSIGDFILGGGEVAALTIIEAVSRLREGVLGNPESIRTESFAGEAQGDLLEHPQYTRPADFRGHRVPDVLLGGDHGAIAAWRHDAALRRTLALRPELRAPRQWPGEAQIALPGASLDRDRPRAPAAELVALASRPGVSALVALGADVDIAAWAAATGGRGRLTAFASMKQLVKRLRQRTGVAPKVIAVVEAPASLSSEIPLARDPRLVLEQADLGGEGAAAGRKPSVILWLPGPSWSTLLAPVPAFVSAVFALEPEDESGVQTQAEGLAIDDGIVDPSRPSSLPGSRLASLAARALDRFERISSVGP